jgi:hypothetical protein
MLSQNADFCVACRYSQKQEEVEKYKKNRFQRSRSFKLIQVPFGGDLGVNYFTDLI